MAFMSKAKKELKTKYFLFYLRQSLPYVCCAIFHTTKLVLRNCVHYKNKCLVLRIFLKSPSAHFLKNCFHWQKYGLNGTKFFLTFTQCTKDDVSATICNKVISLLPNRCLICSFCWGWQKNFHGPVVPDYCLNQHFKNLDKTNP